MSSVHPITSPEDLASLNLPDTSLLVLYFHAAWAAPCKQMSEVLAALASTYPRDAPIAFASVDAEELPDLAEDHDVTAVPYIVLKRGPAVLDTVSGSDAARVRAAVEKHAAPPGAALKPTLPPAQTVTRPATQPVPAAPSAAGMPAALPQTNGSSNAAAAAPTARDLSAYAPAPAPGDPSTAPATSSSGAAAKENGAATSDEDLTKRLRELVKAAPVMLFMKGSPSAPQCGFSRQLVGILREQGVRYGFFNILADDEVRQGLKTFADWPTFPQLWLDGELVGGLDIVREELENDADFLGQYKAAAQKVAAA